VGVLFTVLLPIVRPPVFLEYSARSVLAQSVGDLELLIVCDGAPRETVEAAHRLAAEDPRVRVLDRPKGERHGEAHRHEALLGASGRYVAHIIDDALWMPDHLATLARTLDRADFAHTLHTFVDADERPGSLLVDLADAGTRARALTTAWNFAGLCEVGYRLSAYRSLPVGWSPAPQDLWTDLFMWRKFLAQPNLVFKTAFAVTSLVFHRPKGDTSASAVRQVREWSSRLRSEDERAGLIEEIWSQHVRRWLAGDR
jgi:glycosyltransferase involved in cell wall biosynthesis